MAFCLAIYNYFLLTAWKDIYKSVLKFGDKQLSLLLIVGAAANSSFRIISGILLLKVSFKTLFYVAVTVTCINALTFNTVVGETGNTILGLAYLFLGFAGLGTMVTIFPTICIKAFGSDVGPKIYPIIYLCFSSASLTSYLIYSYVPKVETMFYIFGSLAFLGLLVSIFFNAEPSWHKAMVEEAEKDFKAIEQAKSKQAN